MRASASLAEPPSPFEHEAVEPDRAEVAALVRTAAGSSPQGFVASRAPSLRRRVLGGSPRRGRSCRGRRSPRRSARSRRADRARSTLRITSCRRAGSPGRRSRRAPPPTRTRSEVATERLKLVTRSGRVLGVDELQHVRVVHPQHPHVGAAATASLDDHARGGVEDARGTRRGPTPHRGCAARGRRSDAGRENEKPVPPPDWWITAMRLAASKMLSSVVLDRQHEAGRQLAERRPRVHQRRGCWAGTRAASSRDGEGLDREVRVDLASSKPALGVGHGAGDAAAQAFEVLDGTRPLASRLEVAGLENPLRVGGQAASMAVEA